MTSGVTDGSLTRYAWLSVSAALATIALKATAWLVTGSVGMLSDALESVVNLAAALLALWMLRIAAAPPDADHPFGRSKAEYFASGIEGAMIVLAAAGIVYTALPRLIEPRPLETPTLGIAISVVASAINFWTARVLLRAGARYHSITLEADARHLLTDVWTSAGVLIAVALVALTGWLRLDPLIAFAVAINILWTGFRLMRRSVAGLLDAAIPVSEREDVSKILQEYTKRYGVAFHAVRTRHAGTRRFISFHLLVPDEWTVKHAHQIAEEVEARIGALVPNASLISHIEPISDPRSYDDMGLDR
ncbi:MAG TPA: cation diffusion facilitator family transporter [Burkholderiales bacterium]|nr:cation diffusion facilitator family transporter [Burkholderiales bacterium]